MTRPQPVPGARAVQRALSLLRAFSEGRPGWSLAELSAEVGLSKATASRMLSVLEQEGLVVRPSGSAEHQLGPEMVALGMLALRTVDFRLVARQELRVLADTTGGDATLEALVGSEVLILEEDRGEGLLGLDTEVGTKWPAHATATGKASFAFAENPMTEPPDGLHPLTTHTITSWARRTETLSEVRRKGYATNIEELEYEYRSVAVPIRDGRGRTIAALSVGRSTHRVTMERILELAKAVREAAARVSRRLGYRGQPDQVAAPFLPTRRNNRRGTQS